MARDSRRLRIQSVHHAVSVSTAASSSKGGEISWRRHLPLSMKVPTRRQGNRGKPKVHRLKVFASMKVPARRRGNDPLQPPLKPLVPASMKVPARRRGNFAPGREIGPRSTKASMKVPARRRGNVSGTLGGGFFRFRLNESPRPKAGKCGSTAAISRADLMPQ